MSNKINRLSNRGLYVAVLLVTGFLMMGLKPTPETTQQGPPEYFIVHCEIDGDTIEMIAEDSREIRLQVTECKEDNGKIRGVEPRFEPLPPDDPCADLPPWISCG